MFGAYEGVLTLDLPPKMSPSFKAPPVFGGIKSRIEPPPRVLAVPKHF